MLTKKSFKNKALKRFFEGDVSGVQPDHVETISDIMAAMKAGSTLSDVDFPGMRLHPWRGTGKGKKRIYSLDLNGNDRLLFKLDTDTGMFYEVTYEDPH